MRAVLDPNVLISAMLSLEGAPAGAVRGWLQGEFELVVSELLLEELRRACGYPKLRKRIEPEEAARFVALLETAASVVTDPTEPPSIRSPDLGDDYLMALAEAERVALVTGDRHLLGLPGDLPIFSPVDFLELVAKARLEAGYALLAADKERGQMIEATSKRSLDRVADEP